MKTNCFVCDKETKTIIDGTKHYDVVMQMENKRFFYLHNSCLIHLSGVIIEMVKKLKEKKK